MSDRTEEQLKEFYRERLIPISAAYKDVFPLRPDEAAQSYYIDRADSGNYIHEIDSNDTEGELGKLWRDGSPELAEIAGELMRLADILQEKEETSNEVSPFIYAMF